MTTGETANILMCTRGHVTGLIRKNKLRARKIGPRIWDVDPDSVEEYRSAHAIIKTDSVAAELVEELQTESIVVASERFSLAQLFWMLSQYFLNGIEPGSIFPTLWALLPEWDEKERADAANEAVRKLMFKLRVLQLVHDENRQYGLRGYTVTVSTALGARVIQALQSKRWPRP